MSSIKSEVQVSTAHRLCRGAILGKQQVRSWGIVPQSGGGRRGSWVSRTGGTNPIKEGKRQEARGKRRWLLPLASCLLPSFRNYGTGGIAPRRRGSATMGDGYAWTEHFSGSDERKAGRLYQAKWANALLASAMRWMFSRVLMAVPSRLKASPISWASDLHIG